VTEKGTITTDHVVNAAGLWAKQVGRMAGVELPVSPLYGFELQQEDTDRIEKELILGFERYPALQNVGVKTWVNGAFTFSPDGNPLVGPVQGKRGYWCACAVMAGFLQGGGVGKSLAEWMISR